MAKPARKDAKRPGPKPRGTFENKRRTLTTRITERTRTQLEQAAQDSGRSLSQEIEFRLQRSLQSDDYLSMMGGDDRTGRWIRATLDAKGLIEEYTGKSVWDDFEAHIALLVAARELLLGIQPNKPKDVKERDLQWANDYTEHRDARDRPVKLSDLSKPEMADILSKTMIEPQPPKHEAIVRATGLGAAAAHVIRDGYSNALARRIETARAKTASRPEDDQ